jgi:hypothetical protein
MVPKIKYALEAIEYVTKRQIYKKCLNMSKGQSESVGWIEGQTMAKR